MYVAKGPDLDVQLVPLIVTETANAASSSMNEPATDALRNQQRQTLQIDDLPQRKFPILVLIFSLNERLVSCHVPILMSSE